VKQAFRNKRAKSHLKSACALVVETWMVLIPNCHVVGSQKSWPSGGRVSWDVLGWSMTLNALNSSLLPDQMLEQPPAS
jgi:hypothetical protein